MAADSKIEWTDHTFNPWIGCTKVSQEASGGGGCDGCYAAVSTPVRVLRGKGIETWGAHAPRHRTSQSNWALPKRWNGQAEAFYAQHGRRQRVFCASLADVFDNAVPLAWLHDLFDLIAATPKLDWLLLTKRIGNVKARLNDAGWPVPLPDNVWLGATVVNQAEADRDIPKLLAVPARVRFLSMEPLLGAVNISDIPDPKGGICLKPLVGLRWISLGNGRVGCRPEAVNKIDWVIVGGESGSSARPMHPDWARSLRDQCANAGVPFLFKQWGEWAEAGLAPLHARAVSPSGIARPCEGTHAMCEALMERVGKKAAGRLLDGLEWNEAPQ
ncbi:phage Gp37/Gp68 family protein [Variovorax sp. J22G73]|uniref:phage Gp37/Gp68 family protein n=1 Tax=unclassified Variovorax TaxID=663243 RepID=UPI002575B027|nr:MULTISPECIES: phage Gp37/Gp68 family protein [unclassified Variovorax]MDM0003932.1 phage Gp37/Gp68 family protein [Variovorax sp. J22R203]MDM0096402.1 phage Gp37/Gp68 family protein [Variovorax sp. J22G73]